MSSQGMLKHNTTKTTVIEETGDILSVVWALPSSVCEVEFDVGDTTVLVTSLGNGSE